jgi:hypothetical protein
MKKYFIYGATLILIFGSCKKSSTGDTGGFQWPEGTGPYAPYTLGSKFVYETQTTAPVAIDSFTYTSTKDTTIDGLKFKKLESDKPALASTFYCNYNNGLRTEISYNSNFGGISIPVVKQVVLKDNVAQGATWLETLGVTVPGIPLPITISFNYTLVQKDYTKTILAKDYTGTINAKQVATPPAGIVLPPGIPTSVTVDNFFGKEFGLIERDLPNSTIKIKRATVIK